MTPFRSRRPAPLRRLPVVPLLLLVAAAPAVVPAAVAAVGPVETRCGWLENPTPANIWLRDRDREWIIGVQGGYQLPGDWPWPAFRPGQWLELNGHYGRGCACFRGRVDRRSGRVVEIQDSWPRPLQACREDPALRSWSRPWGEPWMAPVGRGPQGGAIDTAPAAPDGRVQPPACFGRKPACSRHARAAAT